MKKRRELKCYAPGRTAWPGTGAWDPTEDTHLGNDRPKFRDSPNSEACAGECQGFCLHTLLCQGQIQTEPGIAFWLIAIPVPPWPPAVQGFCPLPFPMPAADVRGGFAQCRGSKLECKGPGLCAGPTPGALRSVPCSAPPQPCEQRVTDPLAPSQMQSQGCYFLAQTLPRFPAERPKSLT